MKLLLTRYLFIFLGTFILANSVYAATISGTVKTLLGTAYVQRANERITVAKDMPLYSKDVIMTAPSSFVGIVLSDGTKITAGASTTLNLANYEFNENTKKGEMKVNVSKGLIQVSSGVLGKTSRENVVFNTPVAIIGIRGTNFVIDVGSDDEDEDEESAPVGAEKK